MQHGYFNVFTVGSAGLQLTPVTEPYNGSSYDTGTQVLTDGTLLYASSGQIWNPVTRTQVATLPITTFDTKIRPSLFNFVMDKSLGQLYAIGGQNYGQTYSTVLTAYDMTTLTATGIVAFPQIGITTRTLARWGTDGLAFIGPGSGTSMLEDRVYLLRSGIVNVTPGITIRASGTPTTVTVKSGQTATYSLSISGSAGFGGPLSLTCTGAPAYATCSVSPASLNLPRGGTSTFSVTVTTQQSTVALIPNSSIAPKGLALLAVCMISMCMLGQGSEPSARRRRAKVLITMALLFVLVLGMVSCGGGGGRSTTPPNGNQQYGTSPGTYTLTVTANAQSATASQSLTLIVQ